MYYKNKNTLIANSKWFHVPQPKANPSLRLFCFSYAGGGPAIYHSWPNDLPSEIELIAIQLPGRGARMGEPALDCFEQLVPALEEAIRPYLDRPFAFFGHSMGAKLAFELARYLRHLGRPQPVHLFASGSRAPQEPRNRPNIHAMPREQFRNELRELNGTPSEILDNNELMSLVEPTLRADFKAIELYRYADEKPLSMAISAYGGDRDEGVNKEQLLSWRLQTTGSFYAQILPGDHFFINTAKAVLLHQVSNTLSLVTKVAAAV